MQDAEKYMALCVELADRAASKGNSAVGSLLVIGDEIIADAEEAAATHEDVSCHAEMEVIRKARKILGKDMSKATLFSTKEPCVMCSYAIRFHQIGKVVYKERSGELGGAHGTYDLLVSQNVPKGWGPPVECIELAEDQ
ncbi:deaminase [Flagellimonas nanhaiensis]|uniref:Nucleoside deaminase n=1 Tax=Flagellimonas nanhaiensis TaxID=2292706 RepID=A0A371JRM4_9FLAO|nr:deaminase [Allomuricauda nanhaiensis]RDY60158.1 nucleoside deaminase [Allomuricauda nanhaiensis]